MTLNYAAIQRELGRTQAGEEMQRAIRYGYPTVGWPGDPYLTLYLNRFTDKWEIWDHKDGRDQIIMQKSASGDEDIARLCARLTQADVRNQSAEDVRQRVNRHNAAIERAKDEAQQERGRAALEKVYWGVAKDEASSGRLLW